MHASDAPQSRLRWPTVCIFVAFAAIALFLLISEHRAHALGLLPYLLLAACPLLHLFHHHANHAERSGDDGTAPIRGLAGRSHHHGA